MELFHAHKNWADRPADERFSSLTELRDAVAERDRISAEKYVEPSTLARLTPTVHDARKLTLAAPTGSEASLTHWSAGQYLSALEIPRPFLAKLTTDVATDVVRDRLQRAHDQIPNRLFLAQNGDNVVRAFHGTRYERLWDVEIADVLLKHLDSRWRNPVAYKDGKWGAELVPSGLYASDRDMFIFMIDGGDRIDAGPRAQLHHGFFVSNSEVGAGSFEVTQFLFNEVCGNNIVWGAQDIFEVRARHTASVRTVFDGFSAWVRRGAGVDVGADIQSMVRDAMSDPFAAPASLKRDDEGLIMKADPIVNRLGRLGFSLTDVRAADRAIQIEEQVDGKMPTGSRWDWLQGFTAVARQRPTVDSRLELEKRAAKAFLPVAA